MFKCDYGLKHGLIELFKHSYSVLGHSPFQRIHQSCNRVIQRQFGSAFGIQWILKESRLTRLVCSWIICELQYMRFSRELGL